MSTANEANRPSRVPTEVEALRIRVTFAQHLTKNANPDAKEIFYALNALAYGKLRRRSEEALRAFKVYCQENDFVLGDGYLADTSTMLHALSDKLAELLDAAEYEDDDEEEPEQEQEGGENEYVLGSEMLIFAMTLVPHQSS